MRLAQMRFVANLLLPGLLLVQSGLAQSPVSIVIDPALAGPNIASNFSGLSYEMSLVLPGKNEKHFFSPENEPLVRMFRTLGIKSLRVGGNTAERDTVGIPGNGQVMSLAAPAGDVEAKSGVSLGGASIDNDGNWTGAWTPLAGRSGSGQFKLKVPAATAAIVKLTTD